MARRPAWPTIPAVPNPVYALTASNVVFQSGVPVFGNSVATPPFGVYSVTQQFKMPYAQNYNLNVQAQLTKSTLLQVGYVGNVAEHLLTLLDINQPLMAFVRSRSNIPRSPRSIS